MSRVDNNEREYQTTTEYVSGESHAWNSALNLGKGRQSWITFSIQKSCYFPLTYSPLDTLSFIMYELHKTITPTKWGTLEYIAPNGTVSEPGLFQRKYKKTPCLLQLACVRLNNTVRLHKTTTPSNWGTLEYIAPQYVGLSQNLDCFRGSCTMLLLACVRLHKTITPTKWGKLEYIAPQRTVSDFWIVSEGVQSSKLAY